jgi:hypothetical protein
VLKALTELKGLLEKPGHREFKELQALREPPAHKV